jgi:hypothetical protein
MTDNDDLRRRKYCILFCGLGCSCRASSPLHSQSVDELRSHLFSLRDEMFLYALDHGLLSNPAYCELRNEMNGLIRYAHKLTITQVLILTITSKYYSGERFSSPNWTAHLNTIRDEDQSVLLAYYDTQRPIVMVYLVSR